MKRISIAHLSSLLLLAILCCFLNSCEEKCMLRTDDGSTMYSGPNRSEIETLLNKSKPWRTPSCSGEKDFMYPQELPQACIRDQYVVAAVKAAFVAEYQWRAGNKSEAEEYAKQVRFILDQADALCSNKPTVGGSICTTLGVWPCKTSSTPTTPGSGTAQIAFKNPLYTPIKVTLNGVTKEVDPGSTITFDGQAGAIGQYKAETSAMSAQGTQVGNLITWENSQNFPSSGVFTITLNLSSQWFFLFITNESTRRITKIYVNYGLSTQMLVDAAIPNDKQRYRLGYYRAFTNSTLRLEGEGNWVWTHASPDFKLDFIENQSYTFTAR